MRLLEVTISEVRIVLDDVTICIPSISIRRAKLVTAVESVLRQTHPVSAISVAIDTEHSGAWETRNRALRTSETTWTGFLDDDDELLPHHVKRLLRLAEQHEADIVWGWFEVVGGSDPFPEHRGRQYRPDDPHCVPITYLAKTELLRAAVLECGGFQNDDRGTGVWEIQDEPVFTAMHRLGGKSFAADEVTWIWHHHGRNTSGLPDRW